METSLLGGIAYQLTQNLPIALPIFKKRTKTVNLGNKYEMNYLTPENGNLVDYI